MPPPRRETVPYVPLCVEDHRGELDRAIADLADAQHGVVSLEQLVMIGLSDTAVRKRAAAGRLIRLYRGVYAVGHRRLTIHGRWMAAVLAAGRGAAISHRHAAALHHLLPTPAGAIEVSSPTPGGRRPRPGLVIHRNAALREGDVEVVEAIAVTTVARTLRDLSPAVPVRTLERVVEQAERLGVLDVAALGAAPPALRSVISAYEDTGTREELEHRLLSAVLAGGLPRPRANAVLDLPGGPLTVDLLWPEQRLVVEADSRRHHDTTVAFEADRRRDQRLAAAGYTVVRTTWAQVTRRPEELIATLAAVLDAKRDVGDRFASRA
jgi:Transcriptional regulator, AbiEi antitoxin/Protein of unknown function (DUF559)